MTGAQQLALPVAVDCPTQGLAPAVDALLDPAHPNLQAQLLPGSVTQFSICILQVIAATACMSAQLHNTAIELEALEAWKLLSTTGPASRRGATHTRPPLSVEFVVAQSTTCNSATQYIWLQTGACKLCWVTRAESGGLADGRQW